jgi:hypothetical protein
MLLANGSDTGPASGHVNPLLAIARMAKERRNIIAADAWDIMCQ